MKNHTNYSVNTNEVQQGEAIKDPLSFISRDQGTSCPLRRNNNNRIPLTKMGKIYHP